MAKKKKPKANVIVNRRAKFDYELSNELVVGIVLTGPETRAVRDSHVQLKGSYVSIKNRELWLNNASFSLKLNEKGQVGAYSIDTTPRKLLANRKQIDDLYSKKQAGMTIVPLRFLANGRYIKLVIAIGKGKKHYDKRETIKKRDSERDTRRTIKNQ
ncbi:MAG TPA: SsrA-binding protein SmpB [Candidatus Saccharibacteria bacterium]|nr:SsrA-binding protein SmpB [Candidatus Saccharibacteria bacterium]